MVDVVKRPSNRPFADYSTHDPQGNIFDLMQPGKKEVKGVWLDPNQKHERSIKHITIRAMNPEALAQFYVDVYGFKEEEKALEDPNFYLTDGTVTLVLAPWKIKDYYGTEHKAPGMDHIGFKVESLETFKKDVELLAKADSGVARTQIAQSRSRIQRRARVAAEPAATANTNCRIPEGNLIDVAE